MSFAIASIASPLGRLGPCRKLHRFVDGELDAPALAAFTHHLAGCRRCPRELESLLALRALAETGLPAAALAPARAVTPKPTRPARTRVAWVLGPGLAVAAVALLALVALRDRPDMGPWAVGETRQLEARLEDPRADVYRRYDGMRGTGVRGAPAGAMDYAQLADLQTGGDLKGLASRWLMNRDSVQARRVLDGAGGDPALDNERAVLALLEQRPEQALPPLDRALTRDPRARAALWNRGLTLRELGLPRAAAAAFGAVAERGEPGWAEEASGWRRRLQTEADERRRFWDEAQQHARRLAGERIVPPAPVVDRWPELMRAAWYEAVRGVSSPAERTALATLARQLDARFGGEVLSRARSAGDPWLQITVLAEQARSASGPQQQRLLREAIARADGSGFPTRRLELEQQLLAVELEQGQSPESLWPRAQRSLRAAQSLGAWSAEGRALRQLEQLAAARNDSPAARAYAEEARLHTTAPLP